MYGIGRLLVDKKNFYFIPRRNAPVKVNSATFLSDIKSSNLATKAVI